MCVYPITNIFNIIVCCVHPLETICVSRSIHSCIIGYDICHLSVSQSIFSLKHIRLKVTNPLQWLHHVVISCKNIQLQYADASFWDCIITLHCCYVFVCIWWLIYFCWKVVAIIYQLCHTASCPIALIMIMENQELCFLFMTKIKKIIFGCGIKCVNRKARKHLVICW